MTRGDGRDETGERVLGIDGRTGMAWPEDDGTGMENGGALRGQRCLGVNLVS